MVMVCSGFGLVCRNALTGINRILTRGREEHEFYVRSGRNALTGINRILTQALKDLPDLEWLCRNALTGINRILTVETGEAIGRSEIMS